MRLESTRSWHFVPLRQLPNTARPRYSVAAAPVLARFPTRRRGAGGGAARGLIDGESLTLFLKRISRVKIRRMINVLSCGGPERPGQRCQSPPGVFLQREGKELLSSSRSSRHGPHTTTSRGSSGVSARAPPWGTTGAGQRGAALDWQRWSQTEWRALDGRCYRRASRRCFLGFRATI